MSEDLDDLEQQLKQAERELSEPERELWRAFQAFIQLKIDQGLSREEAYELARDLLRKARHVRARDRRASFKVV